MSCSIRNFDVIRASVPKLLLDDVLEQKNEIAKAVEEELEKAMSASGFEIVKTLIVDILSLMNISCFVQFRKRCCLLARREEGWFSLQELLQELNQRLVKLREVEEAAAQGTRKGIAFGDLRSDIQQARKSQAFHLLHESAVAETTSAFMEEGNAMWESYRKSNAGENSSSVGVGVAKVYQDRFLS
ncbi:hypothetical protein Bca101_070661 [Brassica carinata]